MYDNLRRAVEFHTLLSKSKPSCVANDVVFSGAKERRDTAQSSVVGIYFIFSRATPSHFALNLTTNGAVAMATDAQLAELYQRKVAKLREQKQLAETFNELLTKHVRHTLESALIGSIQDSHCFSLRRPALHRAG